MTSNTQVSISKSDFGTLSCGTNTDIYTLKNQLGTRISITNYGGIITHWYCKDREGQSDDIVLGYDNITSYEQDTYYLGAVIGRYAGRIDKGVLNIDGTEHQLSLNGAQNQLHGGFKGLNKRLWHGEIKKETNKVSLVLTYTSPDSEEGFPGTVNFKVIYSLDSNNTFDVEYFAETDKKTVVNLTQHTYFNLLGHTNGDINSHEVMLNADTFLPMNQDIYPTGELASVKDSCHDFTKLTTIGENIDNNSDEQVAIAKGYDNYWLFNEEVLCAGKLAAQVQTASNGRRIDVYTDQPCVILYTANYIDGSHLGKQEHTYQARAALCIETQQAFDKEHLAPQTACLITPDAPFYSKTSFVMTTF